MRTIKVESMSQQGGSSTGTPQHRVLTPVAEVGSHQRDQHRMYNLHRGSSSGKRRHREQSSMVVDYFYAMQHSDEAVCLVDGVPQFGVDDEKKKCFVLSPIGPEGSDVSVGVRWCEASERYRCDV